MSDTDSGFGSVNVLAASPRRPISVNPQILFFNDDINAVIDDRIDPGGCEARPPPRSDIAL